MTILNASTKNVWKLIEFTTYICTHTHTHTRARTYKISHKEINTNEKYLQKKLLDTTRVEQRYNPEKYKIMNTRSSLLYVVCAHTHTHIYI